MTQKFTAEEVRAFRNITFAPSDPGYAITSAFADRIEADERAVPVAWMMTCSGYTRPIEFYAEKPSFVPAISEIVPLFARPPSQAAQVDNANWFAGKYPASAEPVAQTADSGRVTDAMVEHALTAWMESSFTGGAGLRERWREAIGAALAAQGQGDGGPGFGLSDGDVAALRDAGLKPEEIAGDAVKQQARVSELVHWFARFLRGSANPKWLMSHAMELAYYIATNAGNRHIDVSEIRQDGFKSGLNVTPAQRSMLESIGIANPAPPASPAELAAEYTRGRSDGWEAAKAALPAGVPDGAVTDAARYRFLRDYSGMYVHFPNKYALLRESLDKAIDVAMLAAAPSAPEGDGGAE